MYSRSLNSKCRLQCYTKYKLITKNCIYGNHYQYLLYSNHCYHAYITTKNKHNNYYQYKLIRSFASKPPTDKSKDDDHDDSYLDIDDDEEDEEQQQQSDKARKWKSGSKRQRISSESTTESDIKPSKWDSMKSIINKPFAAIKSKTFRKKKSDDTDSDPKPIKKEKLVHRAGKKSLPSPEQGIMTFIPKHKAQILHILQEECNIFPDEVFPLFPDNKTEHILADAEDWYGEGIQFIDDEKTKQQLIVGQEDISDDEDEDEYIDQDEQQYIEQDDDNKKDEQLLLEEDIDGDIDKDSLIVSGTTPLAKIDTKQITISELMSDKPKTTASKLLEQKASGIKIDERSKFREMSFSNPYKYRRILTPQQIKELYSDETESDNKDIDDGNDELMDISTKIDSHSIWQQEPDNVYEIINLLRELGFKTNQNATIWPYTEFMKEEETENVIVDDEDDTKNENKEIMVIDGGGLNPMPDIFNDFYLLFARFPEILSMEIGDIRRKLHVLEQFQIDDIRILLLKDPRILRRPSHHIRWLLEVFDDYFIDDFSQIIELSPHFLASTSKKEMLKRFCFIHKEILEPYKEYNDDIDKTSWYRNMQIDLKHLDKGSTFIIKHGKTIQKTENIEKDMINGIYLDDIDKENLSDFIIKHPDFIGNANVNRMNQILWLLKKLGIKHKKLNNLLYEYPQILTISPQALHECVNQIKINGVRDYRQYIIDNIHDVLTYSSPVDQIVINNDAQQQTEQLQAS